MTRLALAAAVALLAVACSGRETADDQGLHKDIQNGTSGVEVTFDATVATEPVQRGEHEDFQVTTTTGETLEVDNNTTEGQNVPVHKGDAVVIHGQLYIDPGPRYGVHCTHAHTSTGCPYPGWIQFKNNYYE